MKKRFQKLTSLFLTGAMVATALVGCGNNAQTESAAGSETQTVVESSTPAPTEEAPKEFSYPLEGGRTIKIAANTGTAVNKYEDIETQADTEWAKLAVEATGITVEFEHPTGNADEWFNFMIADDELPDIIEWNWDGYAGGVAGAYADGIAIELNDVIDQYMPNFKAWLEAHPDVDRLIKTDDGKYYGIPFVMSSPSMGGTSGIYFREDILNELGASVPTTMDEWHDLLVQVKEKYNMNFAANTNFLTRGGFANAYISASEYQVNPETGKAEYTYTTDAFREFLTIMNQWYDEGLIDPDFATLDNGTVKAKILNNETFASWGYAGSAVQTTMMEAWTTNEDFLLAPAPITKKDASSEVIYNSAAVQANFNGGAVITTDCEDIEAAARWLDYFWSEEGMLVANFGAEGESYTVENGVPTYTDVIINNPEGLSISVAMSRYIRAMANFPGVQDLNYLMGYYQHQNVRDCLEAWGGQGSNQYGLGSGLSFTEDESAELATIKTEITTHAKEMMVKFVLGEADIETEWDAYVADMEGLKIDDAVAIYQAAYDRYSVR